MTKFEWVYCSYFREVEVYLLALCRNVSLAEELTQQTFFKAMEALPKFRGECDVRTWLCAIGKNCYRDHLRREKPGELLETVPLADTRPGVEELAIDRDQAFQIHRVLHGLPEPYKEVFSLRVFSQLSFAEIGSLFGRSQNWACVTYHRAKQKIKDEMEEFL